MNFEIFDEDFKQDLPSYKKEIQILQNNLILKQDETVWRFFVKQNLKNTRNYYIITTALKVMKSLKTINNYDMALFGSLSVMADSSFIQMVATIVGKFCSYGEGFANHFGVDVKPLLKHKQLQIKRYTPKLKNNFERLSLYMDEDLSYKTKTKPKKLNQ